MKISMLALVPVLFIFCSNPDHAQDVKKVVFQPGDLQPTETHFKVEEAITNIVSHYHYQKANLDDSLSSKIWTNFMKDVDGGKLYFTESEVKYFEKYRYKVDDFLKSKNLDAPYEVFNLYLKKYKARNKFILLTLDKPFDFKENDSYETDRDKLDYAKTEPQLDEAWRKILKSQTLDLKLSGKADTAIVTILKNRYKNSEKFVSKIKSEQVFEIFMNAYTEVMDPHSTYFSPRNAENFKIDMSQSLEGIGALLGFENDYVKIIEVITGGPAFKSKGLAKNDRIIGVAQGDNTPFVDIIGWTTDEAVKLIRGPKGSVVRLQFLAAEAPAGAPAKELRLVREKVKLEDQTAKSEIIPFKQNNKEYKIGLITIPMFYRDFEGAQKKEEDYKSTTKDVEVFLKQYQTAGVDGVLIDVRNNGGGSLIEAITLSGLFITKGPVVQQKDSNGEIEVHEDTDPNLVYGSPMAVITNRFSASASEIFAGAIQDYKRGIIVGEQSYGKGTVQSLLSLNQFLKEKEPLGQLKLTMGKFYRINGSSTQLKGVTPDIEFPSGFSAAEYGESSQKSALPWDQIATTKYATTNNITDKILGSIKKNYATRLKTDGELKKLTEDFNEFKKLKEKTVISLQEDVRKKERDEFEVKRKATKAANKSKDGKEPDVYLTESEIILSDLIASLPSKKAIKVSKL